MQIKQAVSVIYSSDFCVSFCHLVNGLILPSIELWTAEMFWIRLKALGLCEAEKMQQFAVLSYEPSPVSSIDLAFPYRRFPDYSKKFGNGGVSRLKFELLID